MSLPLFTIGKVGFNLYNIASKTGVIGWPDVVQGLAKITLKILAKSKKVDSGALDEMVSLAKSRVPVDTGLLLNGITGEVSDDYCEFRASAVRQTRGGLSEDYARFVEFGHHEGARTMTSPVVADETYFKSDATFPGSFKRVSKKSNVSLDVPPEPFFFPAVDDALEERGEQMSDVIAQSANEDGWETR